MASGVRDGHEAALPLLADAVEKVDHEVVIVG
jgi:hypothetical protein